MPELIEVSSPFVIILCCFWEGLSLLSLVDKENLHWQLVRSKPLFYINVFNKKLRHIKCLLLKTSLTRLSYLLYVRFILFFSMDNYLYASFPQRCDLPSRGAEISVHSTGADSNELYKRHEITC